ncbi:conjugative transposon protein TraN [Pontibacter sp. MBLB2868]|uniref:conjugative transposon protein TraN n=1 Tax=Pontibacter sp. MBLB2868 TaxID=3451555 RepID=UPI003F74DDFC
MKKNILLSLLCLLFWHLDTQAQELRQDILEVTIHQTTSLIFPYAIKSVDRGSRDLLVQVPQQVENVLHVKAAREGIGNTNLTVITSDGRLYSFSVRYATTPETTVIKMDNIPHSGTFIQFTGTRLNEGQLQHITGELAGDFRFCYGIKDKAGKMKATVEGIYTLGNTLFYRLVLTNSSSVSYDIDFMRFSNRDKKQVKRTATQEEEITPLYMLGLADKEVVPGHRKVLVFALDKFTIGKGKEQVIELFERNGARHLMLKVQSRDIVNACPLLFD